MNITVSMVRAAKPCAVSLLNTKTFEMPWYAAVRFKGRKEPVVLTPSKGEPRAFKTEESATRFAAKELAKRLAKMEAAK